MSDNSTESTPTAATPAPPTAAPSNGAGRAEKLVPHFRFEQESARAREAVATRDEALAQLQAVKEEYQKLQNEFSTSRQNHEVDMELHQRGITHDSLKRFFRNEWRASNAEQTEENRKAFGDWLDENQNDPLYRVHLSNDSGQEQPQKTDDQNRGTQTAFTEQEQSIAKALAAVLNGNPDRFTGQPASGNETEYTAERLRQIRAKNGGTLGEHKDRIMAQWKAKGVFK